MLNALRRCSGPALIALCSAGTSHAFQLEKAPRSQYLPVLAKPECVDWLQYAGLGQGRGTLRSDGVAAIRGGKILFTVNKEPFSENKQHPIWSSSKSVTSALVGAAIQAKLSNPKGGTLNLEDHVSDYLALEATASPANQAAFAQLRLRHLLEMGSGIKWSESYEAGIVGSNVLHMLYLDSYDDMVPYVLRQDFEFTPGTHYNYSSGEMSVVWAVLRKSCEATQGCEYDKLPWKLLFNKLGMPKVSFEQDGAGVFIGSSYVHMSLMDMARVGYMYLKDGMWGEERILPEGFVQLTRTPNPSYLNDNTKVKSMLHDGVYGLTWWLNVPAKGFSEGSYPEWPADMFAALGHYGQMIIVVPSMDLVVVRSGSDLEYNTKINEFGRRLMPCLAQFQ